MPARSFNELIGFFFQLMITAGNTSKIPPRTVAVSEKERLQGLDADLKRVIYGQDHAVALHERAPLEHDGLPVQQAYAQDIHADGPGLQAELAGGGVGHGAPRDLDGALAGRAT